MTIGRRDVNVAPSGRFLFPRVRRGKLASSSHQIGQNATALPDMGDDKHGARVIGGKGLRYFQEGIETAGRAANDDHVTARQMLRTLSSHVHFLRAGLGFPTEPPT